MATITIKTYANSTDGYNSLVTDLTTFYDWTKIDTETENTTKFYVDDVKYISVYQSGQTFSIKVINGRNAVEFYSLTNDGTSVRFIKCKTGVIIQAVNSAYAITSAYSPLAICNAKNLITSETGKAIFFTKSSSSWGNYYLYTNDNCDISVITDNIANPTLNSQITSIAPVVHKDSQCAIENLYYFLRTEQTALSYGQATLNGKSYYMCGKILMED